MKKPEIAIRIAEVLIVIVLVIGILALFRERIGNFIAGSLAATPTPGYFPDLSVSLSSSGGMSMTNSQLKIDASGNVSYDYWGSGQQSNRVHYGGKVSPQQVQELVASIRKANIWGMKDSYPRGCTDVPNIDLSITLDGQSKQISYYGGCCTDSPQALCKLQQKIEATGDLIFPTPTPEPTRTPAPLPPTDSMQTASGVLWNAFLGSPGGTMPETARGVTLDADGNVYIVGDAASTWGDPVNAFAGGGSDAFVAKMDSQGALIWSTFLGSTANDGGYAVAVDPNGYIYVAGASFGSWGSPVTPFGDGDCSGFVAKLDPNGVLLWNTFPGSTSVCFAQGIAVDGSGNAYITGIGSESWGNPVNRFSGRENAFVARLDSNGHVVWNTFLPADSGIGFDIALDASGNSYVAGQGQDSQGTSLNPEITAAFVTKVDNRGAVVWNTFLGSNNRSAGANATGIALDRGGNIYITGMSSGAWGSPVNTFQGWRNAFVAKLDGSGALVWNTFFGGGDTWGQDIAVDTNANAYSIGISKVSWGAPGRPLTDDPDAFVAKVDSNGTLAWNTFLGGRGEDFGMGIAADGRGSIYAAGESTSTWGNPVIPFSGGPPRATDAFVARLPAIPPAASTPVLTKFGDFGILSQRPCGPPCLLGIRPGITTFDDAERALKNAGIPCNRQDIQPHGQALVCGSGETSISVATVGLCTSADRAPMVGGMSLQLSARPTLSQFITRYGPPDWLQISGAGPQAIFYFGGLQTAVVLRMPPDHSNAITPGTSIESLIYLTTDDYSTCTQNPGLQPWKGYGTYLPGDRVILTPTAVSAPAGTP